MCHRLAHHPQGAGESATSSGVMSCVWILAGVAIVTAERTTAMIVSAWPWSLTTPRPEGAVFGPLTGFGGSALWLAAGLLMFLMGLLPRQRRTLGGGS